MPWNRHCEREDGTRTIVETRRIDGHAGSAFRSSFATLGDQSPATIRRTRLNARNRDKKGEHKVRLQTRISREVPWNRKYVFHDWKIRRSSNKDFGRSPGYGDINHVMEPLNRGDRVSTFSTSAA